MSIYNMMRIFQKYYILCSFVFLISWWIFNKSGQLIARTLSNYATHLAVFFKITLCQSLMFNICPDYLFSVRSTLTTTLQSKSFEPETLKEQIYVSAHGLLVSSVCQCCVLHVVLLLLLWQCFQSLDMLGVCAKTDL